MPKEKKQKNTPEKNVHKKKKTNWILSIGGIAFVIAVAVMIVNQHVRIDKYSDYIEKRARIYGFTKDGEVVFINIAGN